MDYSKMFIKQNQPITAFNIVSGASSLIISESGYIDFRSGNISASTRFEERDGEFEEKNIFDELLRMTENHYGLAEQEIDGKLTVDHSQGDQLITDRFIKEWLRPELLRLAKTMDDFPTELAYSFKMIGSDDRRSVKVYAKYTNFMVNGFTIQEMDTQPEYIADVMIALLTHQNPFF